MRSLRVVWSLVLVAAACGDDGGGGGNPIDAPDHAIDAAIDAPVSPGTCDYTEQHDATNDDVTGTVNGGTPEATGTSFAATTTTICGNLDSTHYIGPALVDADGYMFAVTSDTDIRIDVSGAGAESLADVVVDLYAGANLDELVGERAKFVGNHAVLDVHVSPGMHELVIQGGNPAAIPAPIAYKARISVDIPGTRCPKLTGAAEYTETRDTAGNGHRANDMVAISNPTETLTTATTDAAEPTGLTISAGTTHRVAGSSADITAVGSYKDIDTFEVTTGPTTNELAVRLNWPGTTQDLDFFVFPKDTVPRMGRSIVAAQHEYELKTFGVKPNTAYWITVANDPGSGAGAVSYALSLCGAAFTP